MDAPPRPSLRAAALLFALAAGYFALGSCLTLEWTDEGQILYPSWRVAQGAMPYRDFHHVYGPSLFYLNGALLRVFGDDLAVVRISLVALRAAIAALVYLVAARIVATPWALAAWALSVAIFGAPWWLFNTPYANHYALACTLTGLALYGAAPGTLRAAAAAGLAVGLAATFKQTTGLFTAIAFLWIFLYERDPAKERAAGAVLALRWVALAGSLLPFVGYVSGNLDPWTDVVLLGPALASVLLLAWRERQHPPSQSDVRRSLGLLSSFALACALPLLLYLGVYASAGALGELVRDTVVGLPQQITWFVPFPALERRTLVLGLALAAGLASGTWRRAGLVSGIAAAVYAAELVSIYRASGAYGLWPGEVYALAFLIPPGVLWASLPALARHTASAPAAALCLFGSATLPQLFPGADIWHLFMLLPPFVVLLARLLERASGTELRPRAALPWLACTVLLAAFVLPLVDALRSSDPSQGAFARASGVRSPQEQFAEAAALVGYLDAEPQRSESLVVIPDQQMLYFLAGRVSPFDRHEFILYLLGLGILPEASARAFVDEQDLLARLERARPLVVDREGDPASARVKAAFPQLAAALERDWAVARSFGAYRVLEPLRAEE